MKLKVIESEVPRDVEIDENATVRELKEQLAIENSRVIHAGKLLEDAQILKDAIKDENACVHVVSPVFRIMEELVTDTPYPGRRPSQGIAPRRPSLRLLQPAAPSTLHSGSSSRKETNARNAEPIPIPAEATPVATTSEIPVPSTQQEQLDDNTSQTPESSQPLPFSYSLTPIEPHIVTIK
jgi:hypothetical protein